MTVTIFCPMDRNTIDHEITEIKLISLLHYNCLITEKDGFIMIDNDINTNINEVIWFIKTRLYDLYCIT